MLLRIRDLRVQFGPHADPLTIVDGVSLDVARGTVAALVGESGCGKSMTALSIPRLLPAGGRIRRGAVEFDQCDLTTLAARDLQRIRGRRIAMIFQEPMTSLNPVLTIGSQITESLRSHKRFSAARARRRAIELLRRVGIPSPETRVAQYPHELSGGMRQRAMIAMALACEPALLIADEPTTALDVTIQAQIVALLDELRKETGMGVLFITHDLALVAEIADFVYVMYAGRIVESAPVEPLFAAPRHPYAQALLRSLPRLDQRSTRAARLHVIPGEVPSPERRPGGCAFHPRCDHYADDPACRTDCQTLVEGLDHHACACWRVEKERA